MNERFEYVKTIAITKISKVDLVLDTKTGQTCILKSLLNPQDAILRHQFLQEIQILSLNFSELVPHLIDIECNVDAYRFVQRYFYGPTLKEWLASDPSIQQRKQVVLSLIDQLDALHQCGYLYIDHKGENIIVSQNKAHLIDFNGCVPLNASTIYVSSRSIQQKSESLTIKDDLLLLHPLLKQIFPKLDHPFHSTKQLRRFLNKSASIHRMIFILFSVCLFIAIGGWTIHSKQETNVLMAYQQKEETLYSLLEKERFDQAFWKEEQYALFFLKELLKSEDPTLVRAILETIPDEIREKYREEICLIEWNSLIFDHLDDESMSQVVTHIQLADQARLLLNVCMQNEIYLTVAQQEHLFSCFHHENTGEIVEYAIFLKSRSVSEIADIEPYLDEKDEMTQLWRKTQ